MNYQQTVTELECVKKLKSDASTTLSLYDKAKDTWIRKLQQEPGIGEAKARQLAQYVPTARSLYELYQDTTTDEEHKKRLLLAPLFHEERNYPKLSETLYQLWTSTNPEELL